MPGPALVLFFEIVSLLGFAFAAAKLFQNKLYHRYPILFACFLFHVPYICCAILLDVKKPLFFWFWISTEPVLWLFYILMVFELYRLILERHKGIYTLGRWMMYLGMAGAVLALVLLPGIAPKLAQRTGHLHYFFAAERGVGLSLAIFLILGLLLLSFYPVRLSRNTVVHAVVYTVFFLSNTLAFILQSFFGARIYGTLWPVMSAISAGCVLAWFVLLTPKGEEVRLNLPLIGPEHEERILQQLDALNATLLRVSRS